MGGTSPILKYSMATQEYYVIILIRFSISLSLVPPPLVCIQSAFLNATTQIYYIQNIFNNYKLTLESIWDFKF